MNLSGKVIALFILSAISLSPLARSPAVKEDIVDAYAKSDLADIPLVVPLTAEQLKYLLFLIAAALDVVENNRQLGESDAIFGTGHFFWPKSPLQPTKAKITYGSANFKFQSIVIGFSRENSQRPWSTVGIAVHPRNFPDGAFDMRLPKTYFADFELEKAYTEHRQHEAVEIVNVFLYKLSRAGRTMTFQFEARPDVSSLKDQYPRSFHNLVIRTRESSN